MNFFEIAKETGIVPVIVCTSAGKDIKRSRTATD